MCEKGSVSVELTDDILRRAFMLGQERHSRAPPEHHAAFANAVSFAVTGWTGGYKGPSMREHRARDIILQAGLPGMIRFDEAVLLVEEACYGPLTREIALLLCQEHCRGDALGDLEEAIRIQIEIGEDTEDL